MRLGGWYRRHVWPATIVLVIAVLAAGFAALQAVSWGRVGSGVTVAGVAVGGLTETEAARALAADLVPAVTALRFGAGGDEPLALDAAQLGIHVDARATAARAYGLGRRHLPLGLTVWLPGGTTAVSPVVRVDAAAYQKGLEAVRAVIDVAPRDARLALSGTQVSVVAAQKGREVDAVALERAILKAIATGRGYAGPVPTKEIAPKVSTLDAEARAGAANGYLSRPITLRYRSRAIRLGAKQMVAMLSINTGPNADEYPLTFDNDRARAALHRMFAFAEQPPVDARILVSRKGGITVTEGRSGAVLDLPVLLEELDAAASGGGLRTVFVALTPAFPKLTRDDILTMGLSSLGSQFVTYFDPRNKTRAANIALAAKLVDGSVVKPGATFSLNDAIGPRTTNRGFDYAPVIASDNVLRQGVGGGICQYATTLFNAVFFAGLPVAERRCHSLYISHYPVGRDATVAWGSVDFRFRNDTGRSIMIRSWVAGNALTVALVGKTGREVTYTTSKFYALRKPAHDKDDARVIHDADLGPGVIRWEKGVEGRSVRVERTVRRSDGTVLFRDSFVSQYDPMDWVKRVGT